MRMMQYKPENRHANHSTCSQAFTTIQERRESAQKLLRAVELTTDKKRRSVSSMRHNSIDLTLSNR